MSQTDTTLEQEIAQIFNDLFFVGKSIDQIAKIPKEELEKGEQAKQALLSLFEKYGMEIIGNAETEYSNLDGDAGYWEKHGRNGLRIQQTERLEQIVGKEK